MSIIAIRDIFRFSKIKNSISLSEFDRLFERFFYNGGSKSLAGVNISEESAMKFSAVSTCVGVISNDIGMLPLELRKYRDASNPNKGSDIAFDHPLSYVLSTKSNNMMTAFNYKERLMSDILLSGNHYSYKEFNNKGQVVGLKPLDWQLVEIKELEDGNIYYFYKDSNDGVLKFSRDEILHVAGYGNGFMGKSPIKIKMDAIGLGLAAEQFASEFYSQGLNAGGVITLPTKIKDAEGLRKELHEKYEGLGKSHKTLVLEDGMTFQKLTMPLKEAQFIETRRFQTLDIASWYRMPPKMLQDHTHSTYSNNEQQSLDYSKHTLLPWTERIENFCNCYLLTKKNIADGYFVQFNFDTLLKADSKTRADVNHIKRQDGVITANEWRKMDGMNPRDEKEADMLLVNGNMRSIGVVHNDIGKDEKVGDASVN